VVVSLRIRPGRRKCCSFTLSLVDVVVWCRAASGLACRLRKAGCESTRTGYLRRYSVPARQLPAACHMPSHGPRASGSSTKGCPGPIQIARPSLIQRGVLLVPCRTDEPRRPRDRRRGDLVEQFFQSRPCTGRLCPSSRRAFSCVGAAFLARPSCSSRQPEP
jgi:hypothetical protein